MPTQLYKEKYRPQFHFTSKQNWLNDPNGLVYYDGEYHLFFQHNPHGVEWGNMTWGHAVSRDMIHWEQLDHALLPDEQGDMFSGSAAVDWKNDSGFQTGNDHVLVAAYTAHNKNFMKSGKKHILETQCLAFSNDKGRTWEKYTGNPVLNEDKPDFRDPKIFYYKPENKWVMALYDKPGIAFYDSKDLKKWIRTGFIDGFHECPDLFTLNLDNDPKNQKWILLGADSGYYIGEFDGKTFVPETEKIKMDQGKNFYASQIFNDIPTDDGRRIQIAWMLNGEYPNMPFNQQMSFPCSLSLKSTVAGMRVSRYPIKEIEFLYDKSYKKENFSLNESECFSPNLQAAPSDIFLSIPKKGNPNFSIKINGEELIFDLNTNHLTWGENIVTFQSGNEQLDLRFLIDTTSIELFINNCETSVSSCYLSSNPNGNIEILNNKEKLFVNKLEAYKLKSVWDAY